jgi:hypothetical protein
MTFDDDGYTPRLAPPAGEPIGEERARAYVAWVREHAPTYLRDVRQLIHAKYSGASVEQSSVRVQELATWHGPTPQMPGLAIGILSASVSGGTC